ncbi:hypothetical protein D3C84_670690 [compost metagenome]
MRCNEPVKHHPARQHQRSRIESLPGNRMAVIRNVVLKLTLIHRQRPIGRVIAGPDKQHHRAIQIAVGQYIVTARGLLGPDFELTGHQQIIVIKIQHPQFIDSNLRGVTGVPLLEKFPECLLCQITFHQITGEIDGVSQVDNHPSLLLDKARGCAKVNVCVDLVTLLWSDHETRRHA